MSEIIYEEIVDSDSVIVHIKRGKITRCRDCKWWQDNNNGYPVADCKWNREETPDADDFCSCGERREEGEE